MFTESIPAEQENSEAASLALFCRQAALALLARSAMDTLPKFVQIVVQSRATIPKAEGRVEKVGLKQQRHECQGRIGTTTSTFAHTSHRQIEAWLWLKRRALLKLTSTSSQPTSRGSLQWPSTCIPRSKLVCLLDRHICGFLEGLHNTLTRQHRLRALAWSTGS